MKSRNKFLLILLVLALSFCLAFVSSAGEYDFIISDSSIFNSQVSDGVGYVGSSSAQYNRPSDDYYFEICYLSYYTMYGEIFAFQPASFQSFVDYICYTAPGAATYQGFISALETQYSNFGSYVYEYWLESRGNLTEEYFNVLYFYGPTLSYEDGIKEGITQAHEFTSEFLSDNGILYEPWGADGELNSLEGLLQDNYIAALDYKYNNGYYTGYNTAQDEVYPLAFSDGVNASMTRMEDWLSGKNLLKQTTYKDGDLVSIKQVLNNNVVPALDERQALGYELGAADGQALGNTEMYNLFIQEINRIYGTEYSLSDGINEPDLTVLNTLYAKAYEAGELYQLNKMTDDGGISDFLADISGTVLSTFFYLATNISFMGTSALSLISLFVIAVIVIFILKFVLKT